MKKVLIFLLLFSIQVSGQNSGAVILSSIGAGSASTAPDTVKILLTGQSNAWGASSATALDTAANENVFIWNHAAGTPVWKVARINQRPFRTDGYNGPDGDDSRDDLNGSANHTFYFAKKIAAEQSKTVQIVMAIGDGKPIAEWHNGTTKQKYLDSVIVRSVAAGIDKYDLIIWNQGESDNSTPMATYSERLDSVISVLRQQTYIDNSTPIVLVGMPKAEYGATPAFETQDTTLQLRDWDADPWTVYAHTEGLAIDNDAVHYDAASLKIIGEERIYQAWKSAPYRNVARAADIRTARTTYAIEETTGSIDLGGRAGGVFVEDFSSITNRTLSFSNPLSGVVSFYYITMQGVTAGADTVTVPANFLHVNGDTIGTRILDGSRIWEFYYDGIANYYTADSLGTSVTGGGGAPAEGAFVSVWNTTNTSAGSSTSTQIELPFLPGGTYNCVIDWGDGSETTLAGYDADSILHTYSVAGGYTINITGQCEGFQFNDGGDKLKITSITDWGDLVISNNAAFEGCSNLEITAQGAFGVNTNDLSQTFRNCLALDSLDLDTLNLTGVSLMNEFFFGCDQLQKVNSSAWEMGSVTNISNLFGFCDVIDTIQAANWDVSSVTNFSAAFQNCPLLEYIDVSSWTTTAANNMSQIFKACSDLTNIDISGWDLNGVTTLQEIFNGCTTFDAIDVSSWDVSTVQNFDNIFRSCSGLDTIGVNNWTTTAATSMIATFYMCTNLDSVNVSNWDLNGVSNASFMFFGNTALQDVNGIENWDITTVTTFQFLLHNVTLPTSRYDDILISFDSQSVNDSVLFSAGNSTYTSGGAAETARTNLINDHSWTITDGGGI
jgi:surface protein